MKLGGVASGCRDESGGAMSILQEKQGMSVIRAVVLAVLVTLAVSAPAAAVTCPVGSYQAGRLTHRLFGIQQDALPRYLGGKSWFPSLTDGLPDGCAPCFGGELWDDFQCPAGSQKMGYACDGT